MNTYTFAQGFLERHGLGIASIIVLLLSCIDVVLSVPENVYVWVSALVEIICIILMPWLPQIAAAVLLLNYSLAALIPFHGPPMFWGAWLSLAVLGYYAPLGFSAIFMTIASCARMVQIAVVIPEYVIANGATIIGTFVVSLVVGKTIRINAENRRLKEKERELEDTHRRMRSAVLLHDALSGKLSFLILFSGRQAENDAANRENWRIIEANATQGLQSLHQVVDLLDGNGEDPGDLPAAVQVIIRQSEAKLKMMGITGVSRVQIDANPNINEMLMTEITLFLEEIYANILKHCRTGRHIQFTFTSPVPRW